jgi:hypothetical protein
VVTMCVVTGVVAGLLISVGRPWMTIEPVVGS